ncbi:tRNA lysidine(34) synthetase TilS [Massilia sp. 9096]|uniref:tRNA lysidine(34) synthetase TilS n=1 Tax=Massilia sp. 9096 TaxID=1500894 RepID=UPI0009DF7F6E
MAPALDAVRDSFFQDRQPSIAVALSGGLDSIVLLRLAHGYAHARGLDLFAFHVHHGLSPNADAWRAHCAAAAAELGVPFDARAVTVEKGASGIEAAARKRRYAALGEMSRVHGATLLLTAHHLDDQAETVLLQLLRGSGPAGLSGMDAANRAPTLLGDDHLVMARPLLQATRASLEAYAEGQGVAWVEDESNVDPRYARNALRHTVMPALSRAFPGFQHRLARASGHMQSAQRLLDELAEQDLAACVHVDGAIESVELGYLRGLSSDRVNNLLRRWFSRRGLAMPSAAWLEQMVAQLFNAREDAQLLVNHQEVEVRRHRDRLYLVPHQRDLAGMRDPDDEGLIVKHAQAFTWRGEASLAFPDYGGVLHFDRAGSGFDPAWLQARPLEIDFRKGGEKLKLAPNRPRRILKHLYQAADVPAWERMRLPIVSSGFELLFAAGVGMDCQRLSDGPDRIALRWEVV